MLTGWPALLDALTLAHIVGDLAAVTHMVAERHAAPATAAYHQALQQCGSFPRGAATPIFAQGLRRFAQPSLILLVVFPRQIAGMHVGHNQPFRLGLGTTGAVPWPGHPLAATAKHKGAGIAWVMQDLQSPTVAECAPDQLALVRTAPSPPRELQLLRAKGLDDRR